MICTVMHEHHDSHRSRPLSVYFHMHGYRVPGLQNYSIDGLDCIFTVLLTFYTALYACALLVFPCPETQ